MAVVWSEEYATGDSDIDEQHRQLFQYIADLEEHMENGVDSAYMRRFLNFLGLYTRSHFCFEEICMRQKSYPVAGKNKEQHKKLLDAYTEFLHRFEAKDISDGLIKRLHDFLESWLVNHILRIDTHLRKCVNT